MGFSLNLKELNVKDYISKSWEISWPMIFIMFFDFLIGLTDVYIAGRIGKDIVAAYGFVLQIYFVFIVIANSITTGTVSVISRLFGSQDKFLLTSAILSSTLTSLLAGLIFGGLGVILSNTIIKISNIPQEIKPLASSFAQIYSTGLASHYMLINFNGILRSCKMVKKSLKTMAIVCLVNIILDFLLVFFTPFRSRGIAVATVISVSVGCLINLIHIYQLSKQNNGISFGMIKKLIQIGWPIGVLQFLWQFSSMVLFLILSELQQNRIEVLAAFTIGLKVESIIYLPVFGFNMANAVLIGNRLGEKKEDEAFKIGIITAMIGVFIVTIMVILVILNARHIVSILTPNELIIKETVRYLLISMVSEPFMAWSVILSGGLNGAGDTKSVLLRIGLSVWMIRIPLCYLFVIVLGLGPVSVWWTMNSSQFIQALLITKRYFGKNWLRIYL